MEKLICMISTVKNTAVLTTLLTDSLSFFTLPCGCHDATFIIFSLSILPYFISFNADPLLSSPPPPHFFLAGTDAEIFELIGTNRKQKKRQIKEEQKIEEKEEEGGQRRKHKVL